MNQRTVKLEYNGTEESRVSKASCKTAVRSTTHSLLVSWLSFPFVITVMVSKVQFSKKQFGSKPIKQGRIKKKKHNKSNLRR